MVGNLILSVLIPNLLQVLIGPVLPAGRPSLSQQLTDLRGIRFGGRINPPNLAKKVRNKFAVCVLNYYY